MAPSSKSISKSATKGPADDDDGGGGGGDGGGDGWEDDDDDDDVESSAAAFADHRFLVGSSIPSITKLAEDYDDDADDVL